MKGYLNITILLLAGFLYGQQTITLSGKVVDQNSNLGIEGVHLSWSDLDSGTITSADGIFSLPEAIPDSGYLVVSSLGYKTKYIKVTELAASPADEMIISLNPSPIALGQVAISSSPLGYEKLGSAVYSFSELGYWQDEEAVGGELGTRINIPNRRSRLKNLRFFVLENASDSVEVAIRVYDVDKNMPGALLYEVPDKVKISESRTEVNVSLEPYNIVVDDDVVVAVSLEAYHGEELYFSVSATPHGGTAYLRELPTDAWDVRWRLGLGFSLLSSYPISEKIAMEDD